MGTAVLVANGRVDDNLWPKRIGSYKRRKKAKIVTVDFESPQKDEVFLPPGGYDVSKSTQMRRPLSLDAVVPYSQRTDVRRQPSLPQETADCLSLSKDLQPEPNQPNPSETPPQTMPAFFEQAKQLVRKVIHHETPAPPDVGSLAQGNGAGTGKHSDSLSCLLVSQDALKLVVKFVDVTAVCRNKMRDARVLFNSKTVREILRGWAEKLCETVEDFTEIFIGDLERKSNFQISSQDEKDLLTMKTREEFFSSLGAAFTEVSNLALLCFETGIFPEACLKFNVTEMALIGHESTLADVRRQSNEILNKPDAEKAPQGSTTSTLLSLANDYQDKTEDATQKKFYICEEDATENSELVKEPLSDLATEQVETVEHQPCDLTEEVSLDCGVRFAAERCTEKATADEPTTPENKHISIDKKQNNLNSNTNKQASVSDGLSQDDAASFSRMTFSLQHSHKIKNSTLREYVDISASDLLSTKRKTHFLPENVESILCASDDPKTCQSCAEDQCRACFVLRYFPLLNLHKIRTVLNWKQGCRWRTWLAYLVHLEDIGCWSELTLAMKQNDYGRVARIVHDSSSIEPFFSCLRWLFSVSPHLIVDICTAKDISPWEVSLGYMAHSENSDTLGDFLGYISAMQRIKLTADFCDDISVAMTTLYCSLKQSSVPDSSSCFCNCGAARTGSHLLPWQWKSHIDDVIEWVLKTKNSGSGILQRVLELCRDYGYWMGCINIFRHRKDHFAAFEIFCQLGDFQILDAYIKTEMFSISEQELQYLFQLRFHKHGSDDSLNCRPAVPGFTSTIDHERIARVLVRELGTRKSLQLLKDFNDAEFRLTDSFFLDCMRVAEKEMEQRSIAMKMLETLNQETFIENKSILALNIELMKNKELSGCLCEDSYLDEFEVDAQPLRESASPTHWGVNLHLSSSNCPCCTLPFCIHGASASAGLIVFECGHTFHKQCVPEEACLVCYYALESSEYF